METVSEHEAQQQEKQEIGSGARIPGNSIKRVFRWMAIAFVAYGLWQGWALSFEIKGSHSLSIEVMQGLRFTLLQSQQSISFDEKPLIWPTRGYADCLRSGVQSRCIQLSVSSKLLTMLDVTVMHQALRSPCVLASPKAGTLTEPRCVLLITPPNLIIVTIWDTSGVALICKKRWKFVPANANAIEEEC